MPNKSVPFSYMVLANVLAFICFWVYYKCCATSPGEITKKNAKDYIEKYREYYDGEFYK